MPDNTTVQLPPPADIDPNHSYSLVELIDIAQRCNPATRVAWEPARQAAINVGIARAAYLPALTASAVAGWEHFVLPFPSNLVPQGFIIFNAQEFIPQLWFSLSVLVPVALLIAANLLTGRDPARLLRSALAERLATAADFCAGESGAERRLEAQAFEGTTQLRKLHPTGPGSACSAAIRLRRAAIRTSTKRRLAVWRLENRASCLH